MNDTIVVAPSHTGSLISLFFRCPEVAHWLALPDMMMFCMNLS